MSAMNEEKFMFISMEDSKIKSLSGILGNKTCKKIIDYLSENKEASQKDLSDVLKIPMNTMNYNIKKLLISGFVQKRKNFFWSKKGKKIIMYELSNKSIVISPRRSNFEKLKTLLPVFMILWVGSFIIYVYEKIISFQLPEQMVYDAEKSVNIITESSGGVTIIEPIILWFLAGGFLSLLAFSIINWRKL